MNNSKNLYSWLGCFRREILRFLHEPEQTIINVIFSKGLFFLILYFLNHERVWALIPGIMIMTEFEVVFSNLKMTLFVGKLEKTLSYQLSAGISRWKLYVTYVSSSILRSLITCCPMYIILAVVFHKNPAVHPLSFLLWFIVSGIVFCNISILLILHVNTWNSVGAVESYIVAPLTYLSGCLFSIQQVTKPWRDLLLVNPVFHYFNVFEQCYIGQAEYNLTVSLLIGLIFMIASTGICVGIFNRGYRLLK